MSLPQLLVSTVTIAAALVAIGTAHAQVPPAPQPPPAAPPAPQASAGGGLLDIWDPTKSPFIPIPEIGTDPNSGTSFGLLPVFLSTTNGEIRRILAPDIIYNTDLGYGGNFRLFAYPSEDRAWSVVVGAKQQVERGLDLVYNNGILRHDTWTTFYHGVYDRSATGRFFGVGNNSLDQNQSNYTEEQAFTEATIGYNFGPIWQVALDFRPRYVRITSGTLSSLPSTTTLFPQQPGLGSSHEFLTRLFVTYDTRDSTTIPTRGTAIVGFVGGTDAAFLSSVSYWRFGVDVRHIEPIAERFTLVGHFALQYMPVGNDVPFWALNSLGGDRSIVAEQQPLRGFGGDRFVDRNLFASSLELRSKIFDISLFTTDLTFEIAPFIDAGRVFHELGENPLNRLHVASGVGFRAIAKPFIVGYVDVGYSNEGFAVFSGVNYPF